MQTVKTCIVGVNNVIRSNTNIKESAVDQCVQLLEHAEGCRAGSTCVRGPGCRRACRVLLHHRVCSMNECPICHQLKPLCHLHALRCQNKNRSCNIPYCPNKKEIHLPDTVNQICNIPSQEYSALGTKNICLPAGVSADNCNPFCTERQLLNSKKSLLNKEKKKGVTSKVPTKDYHNLTSLPPYHCGLKKYLPGKKLWHPNRSCKLSVSKVEQMMSSISLIKAKILVVPIK